MGLDLALIPEKHQDEAIAELNAFTKRTQRLIDLQRQRDKVTGFLRTSLLHAAFNGGL